MTGWSVMALSAKIGWGGLSLSPADAVDVQVIRAVGISLLQRDQVLIDA